MGGRGKPRPEMRQERFVQRAGKTLFRAEVTLVQRF